MLEIGTDANFQIALNSNLHVIACFHADWCGLCKEFYVKFKKHSQDGSYSDVLFLYVNAPENILASSIARVENLPFIASFKMGKLLDGVATNKEESLQKIS